MYDDEERSVLHSKWRRCGVDCRVLLLFSITILCSSIMVCLFGSDVEYKSCDGAPYLYATFHDSPHNIIKFSRDGCFLSKNVLQPLSHTKPYLSGSRFRTLTMGKYRGEPALYIANAKSHKDRILVYSGTCNSYTGKRAYVTTAVSRKMNAGLQHPYGITFDSDGNLFITCQHTDLVMRFQKDSFLPMTSRSLINNTLGTRRSGSDEFEEYEGTYIDFRHDKAIMAGDTDDKVESDDDADYDISDDDDVRMPGQEGVRGIVFIPQKNELWVANEDLDGICVVDVSTGNIIHIISVKRPIAVHLDLEYNSVYVSSKGRHHTSKVLALDITTYRIKQMYHHKKSKHPTGIVRHNDILYVADQNWGAILAYNVHSGKYKKTIVKGLANIELITLSDC